jgi:hypothetical protein
MCGKSRSLAALVTTNHKEIANQGKLAFAPNEKAGRKAGFVLS